MSSKLHLQEKVRIIPHSPGIYQFYDKFQKIIYVGKAKDLKKRVSSYFNKKSDDNRKLQVMVSKIEDIRHVVTATESDALLLENNLIKKIQPKYNVLLKDDKTYPWICVKNEPFPRVFLTRRLVKDGSKYFGPYTSVRIARSLLNFLHQIYPIRTCTLSLTPQAIASKKYKVCLEYHIHNCKGPCEALQTEEDYAETINMVTSIIKGNAAEVQKVLKDKMMEASEKFNFEEAQQLKDKLIHLETYQSKSIIVNPTINNVDIFSVIIDTGYAYANFLRVVHGAIIQSQTFELKLNLEETKEELLSIVIGEVYDRFKSLSREIIVPFLPDYQIEDRTYTIPKRGDKLSLLELSLRNAKAHRIERLQQLEKVNPDKHIERILGVIQKDLRLPHLPYYIECFDNSNIQGTNPVAACVVFRDAKPSKRDYRHFNIKTVVGPDDYASMEEVVYRRYSRLLEEKAELPNLIVIDGGKGQLHAALNSLGKLGLQIPILGLAERLEEIYFPGDSTPLHLSKNTETLRVLMHIRDEAHRFGLTFHRKKRSANFIKTELTEIPGIGETTATKLLSSFKTISKIKLATATELCLVAGKRAGNIVYNYYNKSE